MLNNKYYINYDGKPCAFNELDNYGFPNLLKHEDDLQISGYIAPVADDVGYFESLGESCVWIDVCGNMPAEPVEHSVETIEIYSRLSRIIAEQEKEKEYIDREIRLVPFINELAEREDILFLDQLAFALECKIKRGEMTAIESHFVQLRVIEKKDFIN